MSRVLPFGGHIDVNPSYRDIKIVDRSNINVKFSKRPPIRGSDFSLFEEIASSTTPLHVRPHAVHTDPLQLENDYPVAKPKPCGVRITGMNEAQKVRECADPPRLGRRAHPQEETKADDKTLFTAFGQSYVGKAVVVDVNKESSPKKSTTSRKVAPRSTTNVLLPQTLEDSRPKPKEQRFRESHRHDDSLVGVLGKPLPQQSRKQYKLVTPWSTE